ncbi:YggL family protein [Longimicrobium sp.]|uniref:YggL family protein n=1 Tax=Longimicrobium sp. TaxID=2029185 RepID=UPI002C04B6F4|nr:YggL family protein [Longimicrobium sp.]HSU17375.1 YggL family protein [Longimicrobium sp.]
MNKRQRKKHRLGEFQELGFELRFCTPADWSEAQQLDFWDAAITRIEALGLSVGGGTGTCWDVYVMAFQERRTVTPALRQALVDWLAAQPAVSGLRAGPLEDAWHEGAPVRAPAA